MRYLCFSLIPLILVGIVGCIGGSGEPTISTPPAFDQATRIVVTPFIADEQAAKAAKWVPINTVNRLELALKKDKKNIEWIYDQSQDLSPVASKLQELGLTLDDIFADPALAAKVGQALDADLIVVGMIKNLRLKRQDYEALIKKMGRQAGITPSANIYIRTLRSILGETRIKVIDTKTGELIFNDGVKSYLKYWYAYLVYQRNNIVVKTDEELLADLGRYLPRRIAHVLYPAGIPETEEKLVLLRPQEQYRSSNGVIPFD
jgi:hypothetical protein